MTDTGSRAPRRRVGYGWLAAGPVAASAIAIGMLIASQPAVAATAPVGLGTAGSFAVLAGTTVTNTGPSLISGNLGVSPGTAVTGFPPGIVTGGTIHQADGVAGGAQSDLTTAYNDAAGRSPTANVPAFIGAGQTLAPGVYKASSSLEVGGSLTLDAHGDPNAVWIFQAPSSTLITDSASSVILTNGAQACNVFWQVGSSATLGTNSTFAGTILALTS
ncbi:MAG TPA: ice-binding family protein, partial [Streptosporangiaceae bacterium]|nr:ice-binding family protein [Streptosporangiaceae bacterium]